MNIQPSHEVSLISPKEGYRFGLTARLERLVERKQYEDSSDASLVRKLRDYCS